jgi:hypothetical protein
MYFPFLTFNKLPLHPCVLPFFLVGHKEFGNLLITEMLLTFFGEASQELKGKMLCLLMFSSNPSLPVLWPCALPYHCLAHSMLLGYATLVQPQVAKGVQGLCTPTSHLCGRVLVDMQPEGRKYRGSQWSKFAIWPGWRGWSGLPVRP